METHIPTDRAVSRPLLTHTTMVHWLLCLFTMYDKTDTWRGAAYRMGEPHLWGRAQKGI